MKRLRLQETAAGLDLPVHTLERWIRQGRIPVVLVDNFCVFREEALARWARQHHMPFRIREKDAASQGVFCSEGLGAALQRGAVMHLLDCKDREDLLWQMVRAVPFLPPAMEGLLLEKLLERESMVSTGVGRGIALPHPRVPLDNFPEKSCIITAFPHEPVAYGAMDGQPVFVLFLLLARDVKAHLHLLSRLSHCLQDERVYALLMEKPEKSALLEMLAAKEKALGEKQVNRP
ncbi:phosphotransferase IIA-like nitrogen-regulatory protein PtsN [Desulfobotulus alkaliphilus]|uniref:Phosphotransferase IIA-like nitrogen-regulatory protein PtsN n=1 Tax=Desulfobotulus alkaliphilus TaxID=622671 RepID=A0A562RS76_9BACT|nr:PTS sugar transporter subunit IIA [Desulfobotulus alkaliphilus]TWI71803.1 phosphotransferase IIA-like nitrogen-regulatory protein PtsN [Desulfobotulus alkaliphilus]